MADTGVEQVHLEKRDDKKKKKEQKKVCKVARHQNAVQLSR
jgi:hypothetical protein